MKRRRSFRLLFGVIVALSFVLACGLLKPTEPIPTRTVEAPTTAPAATSTPTETAVPPASATPTPVPSFTSTAPAVASATFTATQGPSAPTLTSTDTPVPSTATFTATPVRPTATQTPVPPVMITDWRGEYYANRSLLAPIQVLRNDRVVDLSLPAGTAPAPNMPSENWSARWSRTWNFQEGNYRFRVLVDDGARLWVAGRLLIDAWADGPAREFTADLYLRGGVSIQLDYYNHLGDARVRLNWEQVTQFSGWMGSYYAVPDLSGLPVFQRDDPSVSFNWGTGSPRPDMPADNFSVRWSRQANFAQPGQYRFRVEADDGVRLWVNGKLVIDDWRDGYSRQEAVVNLITGAHDLRLEYYERWGEALVQLSWEYMPPVLTPTETAVPATDTPTSTATPTPTPTVTLTQMPVTVPADTATARPPDTAVPIQPALVLQPDAGSLGVPFTAMGSAWPANTPVDLFLVRSVPVPEAPLPIAHVTSDGAGAFLIQLVVPEGEGWEGLQAAIVLARSSDQQVQARATYRLLPLLTQVSFGRILAIDERFALSAPTCLALDSEAAWTRWFGPEPPPADPPVDWQRELVLGAFLGPQPANIRLDVASVVQRGATVSVWLNAAVPPGDASGVAEGAVSRILVRVRRDALLPSAQQTQPKLVFAFLDANGRLLAQGPAGAEALLSVVPAPQMEALAVPAEEGVTAVPEAPAPEVGAAPKLAPSPTTPAAATPSVEAAPPARTAVAWLLFGFWVVVGAGLVIVAVFALRRHLRSR